MRNLWSYMIIFCGHFPDGALHFTEEELEDETRAEWYLRQMLGSANFEGGRLLHIMSGNLGYQIEHHLFPDLPSNRYPEIAVKVRALCDKYDIPYTTGPLHHQYGQALRTIMKLSLPNSMTSSDKPEPPSPSIDRGRRTDAERPTGVPRPAATTGQRMIADVSTLDAWTARWVTQCALSRICGACARPLGRPIAFVGTAEEVGRNAFHLAAHAPRLRAGRGGRRRPRSSPRLRLRVRPAGPGDLDLRPEVRAQLTA